MLRFKLAVLALVIAAAHTSACTLWGAAGSASAEGTLLAKNRDWKPDHVQSIRLVHKDKEIAYLGLFADTGTATGLRSGVNEAGLSVVSAEASSLPKAIRDTIHQKHNPLNTILAHYHNLDEVNADAQNLFSDIKPVFLLLADAKGLMQVEVGQDGHYAITRSTNGTLAHTNHYFDTSLITQEQKIGPSSATRLQRVNALLAENKGPHTLEEFSRISQDRHDGADNSLWRNGKEFTLAGWQIALPNQGAPHLHLVLANPGMPQETVDWQLDDKFWAQSPQVLLGHGA